MAQELLNTLYVTTQEPTYALTIVPSKWKRTTKHCYRFQYITWVPWSASEE